MDTKNHLKKCLYDFTILKLSVKKSDLKDIKEAIKYFEKAALIDH